MRSLCFGDLFIVIGTHFGAFEIVCFVLTFVVEQVEFS